MRATTLTAALLLLPSLTTRPAAAQTVSDTATTPAAEHTAGELMHVMHLDDQWQGIMSTQLDVMVTAQPLMAPYRETMRQFFDKYVGWTAVAPGMQHIYAQTFTEAELRDLIAFYSTPTGQKSLSKLAELQTRGRAIGEQLVAAHRDELTAAIAARAQQLAHESGAAATPSKGAPPSP
jgi:hypothetical protein